MARTPPRDTLHSTVRYVSWRRKREKRGRERKEEEREEREGKEGGRGDRRMDGGEEKRKQMDIEVI